MSKLTSLWGRDYLWFCQACSVMLKNVFSWKWKCYGEAGKIHAILIFIDLQSYKGVSNKQ